jgi:Amt family ammonium transporter
MVPALIFVFFWGTLVYSPIACWVWNTNGWAFKYGVLDYAGGGPVEIASGLSALAYSMVLGKRQEKMMRNFRPHNISMITLGTVLLWFGWLGFNGGSAFGANLRAVYASWNSNLAAVFGGFTWVLLDYHLANKWSMVGFCSGIISGLVAATPASGFINIHSSILLGVVAGACCNWATKLKFLLRIDDSMDVFAEHGVGGIVGLIFNALFGADYIISLDGINNNITGGWVNHNYKQLYIQIAYILAVAGWSFTVSALIAIIINKIPGLHLRASETAELHGMDEDQVSHFQFHSHILMPLAWRVCIRLR